MDTYVILDSQGNFSNFVIADDYFIPPIGCTKHLIPEGYEWNGTEIVKNPRIPKTINIETI
jgi:hypothetical protein